MTLIKGRVGEPYRAPFSSNERVVLSVLPVTFYVKIEGEGKALSPHYRHKKPWSFLGRLHQFSYFFLTSSIVWIIVRVIFRRLIAVSSQRPFIFFSRY